MEHRLFIIIYWKASYEVEKLTLIYEQIQANY